MGKYIHTTIIIYIHYFQLSSCNGIYHFQWSYDWHCSPFTADIQRLTIVSLFITIPGGACYHVQGDMGCHYSSTLTTQPPINGRPLPIRTKNSPTIFPLIRICIALYHFMYTRSFKGAVDLTVINFCLLSSGIEMQAVPITSATPYVNAPGSPVDDTCK